jgi:rubredoxin/uncharacterized membrane protein
MKKWKCMVCGYIHEGEEPPAKCPVCGADRSRFILMDEEQKKASIQNDKAPVVESATVSYQTEKKWKCLVCGYIHKGEEPPAKCPVCGADQKKFILIDPPAEAPLSTAKIVPKKENKSETTNSTPTSFHQKFTIKGESLSQLAIRFQLLTRLHTHPIAVHIPNGVLPLTTLFTIFAFVFKSNHFAIAAKYNAIFVCISMPGVLLTGGIDWFNRFNGQITQVFMIKIACGIIVTFLTLIIAVWWMINPVVYYHTSDASVFFLFLNLIDLATAAIAGFYGGKLVFNQ